MQIPNSVKTVRLLAFAAVLFFAGCESAEERAEAHFQSGLALIEAGDPDRALVELRNVFQLNGSHREARRTIANLLLEAYGNRQEAYSQYLRLAEQYPDDLEARIALSEIAFGASNWDEVERHGAKAEDLSPDDPKVQAITIARAYRAAAVDEDEPARRAQAQLAEALLSTLPENLVLRNIQIDAQIRAGDVRTAIAGVDWLLERDPDNRQFWRQRLNLLGQLEDYDAIEAQLRDMIDRFPDDLSNKETLIRFHMARNETDKAEAFLRELVAADPENPTPRVDLVRFLSSVVGADAARAEVDRAIAEMADPVPFQVIGAGLDFEEGDRDKAVATLEAVLADAEPSEQTRDVKVTLSRMLVVMNNNVGARALVEEVLVEDETHPEALKLKAAWLIEGDQTDEAISGLRVALDQQPEDADAMTLMARAYERAGRPELSDDFLALAVEASGNAPEETIRYATTLIQDQRYLPAEDILLPALRLAPQNLELLSTLGRLYMYMEDFGRVEQVVQTLRRLTDPRAQNLANQLETERLNRTSGPEDAMAYLEQLGSSADATLAVRVSVIRARLASGDLSGALQLARELAAEEPDNIGLKGALASTEALNGNLDIAADLYRDMIEERPDVARFWLELSLILTRQGDREAAQDVLDRALEVMPENINLLWAQASYLEREGDVEGAIAVYEDLYARNSNAAVVANNLASLLSTYRSDQDSLDRAWVIARRFKDTQVAALQDTYGWIAHRRGDSAEALSYLEGAAEGLPGDPLVQYHLGHVYLALERREDALRQFERAIELAGIADTREQILDAREQVRILREAAAQEGTQD